MSNEERSGARQLLVPVFSDGERRGEESLPVVELSPGRYRLLASPGFAEGLAADDELELDDAAPLGHRVLRRGVHYPGSRRSKSARSLA